MSKLSSPKFSYIFSTVGRKQLMGVAGLGLALFVLTHAAGNLLIFAGPEAYNKYSHALISNPAIYVAELGLVTIFLVHIAAGIILTIRNRAARETKYAVAASGAKSTSKASKTMMVQGIVLLGFVVLHLITFKYGPYYETQVGGVVMRDLFRLVYEVFQSPTYVVWYITALLILCFHLSHGVYSALQTLGIRHPRFAQKVVHLSVFYGVFIAGAFISQPLYMKFFYKG